MNIDLYVIYHNDDKLPEAALPASMSGICDALKEKALRNHFGMTFVCEYEEARTLPAERASDRAF